MGTNPTTLRPGWLRLWLRRLMSEPLDHVERPTAPWRTERLSECGRSDSPRLITRVEFYDRVKAQGPQRAAMSVCMTCWHTAQRHHVVGGLATKDQSRAAFNDPWAYDPAAVLARDLSRAEFDKGTVRDRLNRELRVIALLIAAHRSEFDEAMDGLDSAVTMDALRSQRAAKVGPIRTKRL